MSALNLAFWLCVAWLWGFCGAREICRCGGCGRQSLVHQVFLSLVFWPVHWWERTTKAPDPEDDL